MATLLELQTEFDSINASIKALTQIKMDAAKAERDAIEAAKTDEQKCSDLQIKINGAREFLSKLQANQ